MLSCVDLAKTYRSERGEIRKIEQLLQLQLTRRPLPSGLEQEPARAGHAASIPFREREARAHAVRSFAPRAKFSRRKRG